MTGASRHVCRSVLVLGLVLVVHACAQTLNASRAWSRGEWSTVILCSIAVVGVSAYLLRTLHFMVRDQLQTLHDRPLLVITPNPTRSFTEEDLHS